jgi:hypothetical protein
MKIAKAPTLRYTPMSLALGVPDIGHIVDVDLHINISISIVVE